jgi:hypothetical protein
VGGIFILRQRRVLPVELESLGPRLAWFDNYFECALSLYARGLVAPEAVVEVARETGLSKRGIGAGFSAVAERPRMDRGYLEAPRRALMLAGLMEPTKPGRLQKRVATAVRRALGRAPMPFSRDFAVPDYVTLVDTWSHRRRKERR